MTDHDSIQLDIKSQIATITLNRPEVRNAFNHKMVTAFIHVLQQIEKDETVKVVLIRGNGHDFCAGADIGEMREVASKDENLKDALNIAQLMYKLDHLSKPILTILSGAVFGGGIGLVACSDIVIALPDTTFCFSEVKLGLVPAIICPYVLRAIGSRACRRYMQTAERFSAEEGYRLGLVHEVIKPEQLQSALEHLIDQLKQNGHHAMAKTKKLINTLLEEPEPPILQMEHTATLTAHIRTSREAQEGLSAFLEKRSPIWQET